MKHWGGLGLGEGHHALDLRLGGRCSSIPEDKLMAFAGRCV
jgi:hypothetical protein